MQILIYKHHKSNNNDIKSKIPVRKILNSSNENAVNYLEIYVPEKIRKNFKLNMKLCNIEIIPHKVKFYKETCKFGHN